MRVILLAGGYGTRLKPLTDTIPKCLVPINGEALLDIWLRRLSDYGLGPFLVNTHYLADQVKNHLQKSPFKNSVIVAHEEKLKGTAGTLIQNAEFFSGDDGMLLHADNYCMADFELFQRAHVSRPAGCEITMMTFRTDTPSSCGIVTIDSLGVLMGFHEKVANPPGNVANGAVYILSSKAISTILNEFSDAEDFSTQVLPNFIGRIYTHETKNYFLDIGTPENYNKACINFNNVKYKRS